MTDQETSEAPKTPATQTQPHWIVRSVQKIKCYFHQRCSAKKQENSQDRSSRRTATATVWIAILTVAVLIVGGLQYITFDRQLAVMQGQLNAMQDDQRPWVSFTDEQFTGPLSFAPFLTGTFELKIRNTGKTPAANVGVGIAVLDGILGGQSLLQAQKAQCGKINDPLLPTEWRPEITLFPGDVLTKPIFIGLTSDDLKKITKPIVSFVIVGCINYKFINKDGWHQTGFIRRARRKDLRPMDINGPPIAPVDLQLIIDDAAGTGMAN